MRNKLTLFIPLLLLLALAVAIPVSSFAPPPVQGAVAPIRLKAATFTPAAGETASIPPGLAIAGYARGQRGYYIVQFQGPVQQAWKDAVVAAGGEVLEYIPEFAFKVRMTPAQAGQVQRLDNVGWVGLFHPAYKLSPDLARDGTALYTVRVERGANAAAAATAIAQSGAQVLAQEGNILQVAADSAQLDAIARVTDVAWVQNFTLHEKHNEYGAGGIIGGNTANANGYDGSSQIAAVADTGLGDGTAQGAHPDIQASRITAIFNWTSGNVGGCYRVFGDGPQDVDSGHGTHVAASVLSDGGTSGEGRGTAPAANLVFQAVEDYVDFRQFCASNPDGYYLIGIPLDLRQLFQQAYNAGARIHANSWGSDVAGDYTADSAYADEFVWNNRDMVITFSAGNSGTDANNNGVIDNDSIGSPATAKNVITIGASENDRQGNYQCDTSLTYTSQDAYQAGQTCGSMGGQNILGTWGSRYGFVGPMANDLTAGNQEQMAGWSSRGPTDDNRIKPDVVAPGTWILSGYSDLYQEGYDGDPVNPQNGIYQWDGWGMPVNKFYKYMGGTSMSNPIAAGAATVVKDFYQKAHGINASAALVKATLINSAVDMLDENNDGANDNDFPIPNVHEGWGRIDVASATDDSHQFVDNATGIGTGGNATYQFNVSTGGSPFKVTLVWSDYPSTESASINLVNDLDLTVTAPGGGVYRGNVFSGGWSQTGGNFDRRNNVENVYVQSAASGTWTVQVSGFNVPQSSQPFALVVDGVFGAAPTPTDTPTPGPTATATATATASPTPEPTSTPTATATPGSATTMHVGDLDGASINNGSTWTANVTITIHDNNHDPVSSATVSGSWSNGASGSANCTTNSSGQCTVSVSGIPKRNNSATFTVSNVSHATLSYNSGANHDPDGDSNGTAITISKP